MSAQLPPEPFETWADAESESVQTIGSALDGMGQCGIEALRPFRTFGQYLTEKTSAMVARSAGDIDKALQHESMCASLYKRLPEPWKW